MVNSTMDLPTLFSKGPHGPLVSIVGLPPSFPPPPPFLFLSFPSWFPYFYVGLASTHRTNSYNWLANMGFSFKSANLAYKHSLYLKFSSFKVQIFIRMFDYQNEIYALYKIVVSAAYQSKNSLNIVVVFFIAPFLTTFLQ